MGGGRVEGRRAETAGVASGGGGGCSARRGGLEEKKERDEEVDSPMICIH
jgi:hypothetical protein